MFSKKSKKKKYGQGSNYTSEGSRKTSLPRTIYLMNINELRQTALLYLPKRTGPIEEGKQDERQSVSVSLDGGEKDSCSDSEKKITRDTEETSSKSSEENSLDELFLKKSARKPPPKICRSKGRLSEHYSDSFEMDQCTLLSPEPSPVKRSRGGNKEEDSNFSLLKYSLSSPTSTNAGCGDDMTRVSQTAMTIESSVGKPKPDLSFLDDIF